MMDLHISVVTIDKRLQIARADKTFYEYIGFEVYNSLVDVMHSEDLELFRKTVKELAPGESAMLLVRLRKGDGAYRYMLMELFGLPVKQEPEPYVEVKVLNVGDLKENLGKIRGENYICNEYLDFIGGYLFRYDAAQDFFQIFNGGAFNRAVAFGGTLSQFRQTMLQKELVGEAYQEDFADFCDDIANGTKSFEYKLLLLGSSVDPQHDIHILRARTVQNEKGEPVVLGCIHCQSDSGGGQSMRSDFEKDVTTGALSKKAIIEYAENLLRRQPKHKVNLCVVDIDNFKQVNDTLGHLYGDKVLAEIADILKEAVAGRGLVGRIGGDEMFIVLEDIKTLDNLRGILRSIRSNVEWKYKDKEGVTCSIGVSTYPDNALNYDDLFKIADKMLYRAKEKGKNRYIVYTPDVHGDVLSEGETAAVKGEGKQQDREGFILGMLECLANQQTQPYGVMLQNIGMTFGLDEIQLFYREGEKILVEHCWNAQEGLHNAEQVTECLAEENFVHLYKGPNMAVIDSPALIEKICPKTYQYLIRRGIKAALVYKMNFTHHEGYIAYCKMSDLSRKWSDSDKERLTYVGKVVELLFNDK